MPNKLEKFRRKIDRSRRAVLDGALTRLVAGDFTGLDMKKLRGYDNRYRVRIGDIRIKFSLDARRRAENFEVEFRSDTTYR